jgi:hypothetical protein
MSTTLSVEQIVEFDLLTNSKDSFLSAQQVLAKIEQDKQNGWECVRFNNTLFFSKVNGAHVEFHTLTADKVNNLIKALLQYIHCQKEKNIKFIYTYFDHPTIKRIFAKLKGAEKIVYSNCPHLGKYKVIIDLDVVAKQEVVGK